MTKKKSLILTIVLWVIVALLGIAALAFFLRFTNGGTESFKTFYVTYGDETILSSDYKLSLDLGTTQEFGVKYLFDTGLTDPRDYNVAITANTDADFEFSVGGLTYTWRREQYFSEYFNLTKDAESFSITIPEDACIQNALEARYPGKTIKVPALEDLPSAHPYTIVVSSYDEKVAYYINFSIPNSEFAVKLNPSNHTF